MRIISDICWTAAIFLIVYVALGGRGCDTAASPVPVPVSESYLRTAPYTPVERQQISEFLRR